MRYILIALLLGAGSLRAEDFQWVFNKYVTVDEDESVYVSSGRNAYIGRVVDDENGTFWAMGTKPGTSVFGTRCGDQLIVLQPLAGDND